MPNTSATGGYLVPTSSTPLPGGLSLDDFIQTVLVGISGLTNTLVRPNWQEAPPKPPDIATNWLAFGVEVNAADANAWVDMDADGVQHSQRQENLDVKCSFYGPLAMSYAQIVRDGFQIQQNLEALRLANMGFVSTGAILQMPDLVNERYITKVVMSVHLRREIKRIYPVLSLEGAGGTINSESGDDVIETPWQTPEEEP